MSSKKGTSRRSVLQALSSAAAFSQAGRGAPQAGQGAPQTGQGAPQTGQGAPQARQGAPQAGRAAPQAGQAAPQAGQAKPPGAGSIAYPRRHTGPQLKLVAFPLGGVGAGSVSLGGRGQLCDWEIFNKPDKGFSPTHAYPCLRVSTAGHPAFTAILESQIQPPFDGASGLGANNLPGMVRLESAVFTGEYPLATVDFSDPRVPVEIQLRAFSPFVPLDLDESGLPVAILRYRVRNRGTRAADVSLCWVLDNPIGSGPQARQKTTELRAEGPLRGLLLSNPGSPPNDPLVGSIALAALDDGAHFTAVRGWPAERWWASPMLFWDDFADDGELGPEAANRNSVGAICLKRGIAAGGESAFTFLLAWHFPNRTPARCGWTAPKGHENDVIGNWYAGQFADAWAAAEYTAANLPRLEAATMEFVTAMRETTLPGAVKDAAAANLSTLASTTCFRTADGEFHGFEGSNDKSGCCYGNCAHVWNYEVATDHLFPAIARSFREASFTDCMDEHGAIHFRQMLPRGLDRSGFAAADGQMGQIVKAYLDWKLGQDERWLRAMWPRVRRAVEFCWIPGGWDANRDGVMEGAQHNTYDVEFFGPNPQCGIYYLAGLRAAQQMAQAAGDEAFAVTCGGLADRGRSWIDGNLFNGDYYIQQVKGASRNDIFPILMSDMGSTDTVNPSFQVGQGCLVDQLVGQYLAELAGLGDLLDSAHIRRTMKAIWDHNLRRTLRNHEGFQRTYALNDESALIICDYKEGERPRIPFPYYAEAWTGMEYMAASLMIHHGMIAEGVTLYENARRRFDGVRRNPFDEEECGHHYARALSAWSGLHALAGFSYDGASATVRIVPRWSASRFKSVWAAGAAWGVFTPVMVEVRGGTLAVRRLVLAGAGKSIAVNGTRVPSRPAQGGVELDSEIKLGRGDRLEVRPA